MEHINSAPFTDAHLDLIRRLFDRFPQKKTARDLLAEVERLRAIGRWHELALSEIFEFTTELTARGLTRWKSFFATYLKITEENAARFYYTCEPGTSPDMTRVRVRCPSANYAFLIGMSWGLGMQ